MALELKDAANRYELLKKESQEKTEDLKKALETAKETRSEIRAAQEELWQACEIAAGKPYYCELSSAIRSMPLLIKCGVLRTHIWTCQRVLLMRRSFSRPKKAMKQNGFSGHSLACQGVRCC